MYSYPHPITVLEGEDLSQAIVVFVEVLGGLSEDRAGQIKAIRHCDMAQSDIRNPCLVMSPKYNFQINAMIRHRSRQRLLEPTLGRDDDNLNRVASKTVRIFICACFASLKACQISNITSGCYEASLERSD